MAKRQRKPKQFIELSQPKKSYAVRYQGQDYVLSLRTCDDGYISGYERKAVEMLVAGWAASGGSGQVMASERQTNEFMAAVLNPLPQEDGRSFPWASFFEIDSEVVEEIYADFFPYLIAKTERSASTPDSIRRNKKNLEALRLIYSMQTFSNSTTSTPPEGSTNSSEYSEPEAGSK